MRRARLNGYWLVRPRNGKKMVEPIGSIQSGRQREAGFGLREREKESVLLWG